MKREDLKEILNTVVKDHLDFKNDFTRDEVLLIMELRKMLSKEA